MLTKKFKVRVKYGWYYDNRSWYKIQYSYHWLIPIWKDVRSFSTLGEMTNYSARMFTDHDQAVRVASEIKSINDIKDIKMAEQKKYDDWIERRNCMWNNNKPVKKITSVL